MLLLVSWDLRKTNQGVEFYKIPYLASDQNLAHLQEYMV